MILFHFSLISILNPVYGDTFTNSVYADAVYFLFKDGNFPPLKHLSYVNVSKSSSQTVVVHKVLIHKSVNSFVAFKPVSVVSCNFIKSDFASKNVCNNTINLSNSELHVNLSLISLVNLWNLKLHVNLFVMALVILLNIKFSVKLFLMFLVNL